jgi:hypothetical protein
LGNRLVCEHGLSVSLPPKAEASSLLYHRAAGSGESIALGGRPGKEQKMKRDRNIKKRRRLARGLERAAVPERPALRGPRYLVQPSVTVACAPSLLAIATALREEALVVDEDVLRAVWTFICDGASPFFGRDVTEALREAVRLQHIVVGAETAVLDQEPIAVAV